jgi:AcrR family transcriptional regulator
MPGKVKTKRPGRAAQKNRTRQAIVDAAMRLLASGRTPSITEIMESAQVSRRTIYMYFPTVEQLLLTATLGAIAKDVVDPVVAPSADPVAGIETLSRAVNSLSGTTMHLGRSLIRLTVESPRLRPGVPRRGYRRVEWIERALQPLRAKLPRPEYQRLVSALTVVIGWEPLIVLQDVRGLTQKQAEDVLAFAARALVHAALRRA